MENLLSQSCQRYTDKSALLSIEEITDLTNQVAGWQVTKDQMELKRKFKFKNYHETIGFINAAAWIINQQDHHPELVATYNTCELSFTTHSVDGLTLNDFICAAKINLLTD